MAAKTKRILTKEEKEKRRVSSLARYRRRVAEGVCLLCGGRAVEENCRKEAKVMGLYSRNKGKEGEREWARLCREQGYDAHRTAQFRGNTGAAGDVEGLPGIHQEVKRVEHLNLVQAMMQSTNDAAEEDKGNIPIVAHRKNRLGWLVTMRAEDWFTIYRGWEAGMDLKRRAEE